MSNIRADTLSTLDGTKSITTDRVTQGVARAWVNFNGTGTVAIRASFNVSSITDNGVGNYTVNFATAMPDANYCFVGATNGDGTNGAAVYKDVGIAATTTALRVRTKLLGNQDLDRTEISVAIFR